MSYDAYGDMPCGAPCRNGLCRWCLDGRCRDNAPCDGQAREHNDERRDQ